MLKCIHIHACNGIAVKGQKRSQRTEVLLIVEVQLFALGIGKVEIFVSKTQYGRIVVCAKNRPYGSNMCCSRVPIHAIILRNDDIEATVYALIWLYSCTCPGFIVQKIEYGFF